MLVIRGGRKLRYVVSDPGRKAWTRKTFERFPVFLGRLQSVALHLLPMKVIHFMREIHNGNETRKTLGSNLKNRVDSRRARVRIDFRCDFTFIAMATRPFLQRSDVRVKISSATRRFIESHSKRMFSSISSVAYRLSHPPMKSIRLKIH